MSAETPPPSALNSLGVLRHDLRNPLSEIIGFAEVLIDEARERKLPDLQAGLENIRQSAHRILADVNHTLHPDTPQLSPGILAALKRTLEDVSTHIIQQSQEISDSCDDRGISSISDDLVRISGSARRLRDIGSPALESYILGGVPNQPHVYPDSLKIGSGDTTTIVRSEGGSILVVDDQEANRALLARRLRKLGYVVSLAENGRHALERLRSRKFDLLLLDIMMPEIDGVEVLRQVKADPQLAHIPVLMLSAVDEISSVVRCIELGAADYLPKPFPTAILYARVQSSLANKRMSDQLRKYTEWLFGKKLFADAVSARGFLELTRQERTILFADIRGFTSWSERHKPEEAVTLLNRYFETAERLWADAPVIKTEYTGDEIMGTFATAADAVRVAQSMRIELGKQLEPSELAIGIGLHTGPVIEGLIGGSDVKAYKFVGDTVNTARRICSHAQSGQVLISETTFAGVQDCQTGPAFNISVKGKADPLKIRPLAF